jgi:hypothetical protein
VWVMPGETGPARLSPPTGNSARLIAETASETDLPGAVPDPIRIVDHVLVQVVWGVCRGCTAPPSGSPMISALRKPSPPGGRP